MFIIPHNLLAVVKNISSILGYSLSFIEMEVLIRSNKEAPKLGKILFFHLSSGMVKGHYMF